MIHLELVIKNSPEKGRGVFTLEEIPSDTVIEISPVIVMSAEERKLLDKTLLHDYIFEWGPQKDQCCMALGYIAVYNHANPSNCDYEMDFEKKEMLVRTVRDIKAGEELFINYTGDWDSEKKVWFDLR